MQRYPWPSRSSERWFYKRVHVGVVYNQTLGGFRRSEIRTCPWRFRSSEHIFSRFLTFSCQIGSVPTPWHSWMIASHNDQNRAPDSEVSTFITELSKYVTEFDSPAKREKDDVEFIREKFEYKEEDIRVSGAASFDSASR